MIKPIRMISIPGISLQIAWNDILTKYRGGRGAWGVETHEFRKHLKHKRLAK
jgi:hypothetical protein